jgi:hypothetical protein
MDSPRDNEPPENGNQSGSLGFELGEGMQSEPPQDGLSLRPQLDDDSSSIPSIPAPNHHPSPREAIDKLHDAVMTDLQALG